MIHIAPLVVCINDHFYRFDAGCWIYFSLYFYGLASCSRSLHFRKGKWDTKKSLPLSLFHNHSLAKGKTIGFLPLCQCQNSSSALGSERDDPPPFRLSQRAGLYYIKFYYFI